MPQTVGGISQRCDLSICVSHTPSSEMVRFGAVLAMEHWKETCWKSSPLEIAQMRRINGAIACYITNLLSGQCGAATATATHWMMSGYDCLNKNASTVNRRWTVGLPQQHQLVAYCRCVELQRLGCRLLTV